MGYGRIGRLTIYYNDLWTLSPLDDVVAYDIPFDPGTDSFFNALEWDANSGYLLRYMSMAYKSAYMPMKVEFPTFIGGYQPYCIGSYSMEVKMSGPGAELVEAGDQVNVVHDSINYTTYQVWVKPSIGVMMTENEWRAIKARGARRR